MREKRTCSGVDEHFDESRVLAYSETAVPYVQWRSQPNILGETKNLGGTKCLNLGEQQYLCLERPFSKHKLTRYAKNWRGMAPWLRLYICCLRERTDSKSLLLPGGINIELEAVKMTLCSVQAEMQQLHILQLRKKYIHKLSISSIFCFKTNRIAVLRQSFRNHWIYILSSVALKIDEAHITSMIQIQPNPPQALHSLSYHNSVWPRKQSKTISTCALHKILKQSSQISEARCVLVADDNQ